MIGQREVDANGNPIPPEPFNLKFSLIWFLVGLVTGIMVMATIHRIAG